MTTPFPLDLSSVSPGFAALEPSSRAAGLRILDAAARALEAELGAAVQASARALPGCAQPALGVEELVVELADPGHQIVAEVDATLGRALAGLLTGDSGGAGPARALLPGERAALELLALVALGGARRDETCARLAPRLVRARGPDARGLVADVALRVGDVEGSVRVHVPLAIVARLARRAEGPAATVPEVRIGGRWRRGTVTLSPDDLESLRPGDVVLLDEGTAGRDALVFDGGAELAGHVDGEVFTVEDRTMHEWSGSFPVVLSVEVARVTVALRDLAGVEPGSVLPLHVARDGRVTLRSGDAVVGRGELVEVDGALGVRVSGWEGCK